MPFESPGIHHVTATTDRDQADLDYFVGALGLPLVKKTVNFDNPAVYHFYYANGPAEPGTVMTTFPYGTQGTRRGLPGVGLASRVVFSAPTGSEKFWTRRLSERNVAWQEAEALGRTALWTADPSGLPLAIAFTDDPRDPAPGLDPNVALRGILGVQLTVRRPKPVGDLLRNELGMLVTPGTTDKLLVESRSGALGRILEIVGDPSAPASVNGIGTVHHVAFRSPTNDDQAELRKRLLGMGLRVTDFKDRKYFRSIYFRDMEHTGGVLFEVATDGPGFSVDEEADALGRELRLPPGLSDEQAVREGLVDVTTPSP